MKTGTGIFLGLIALSLMSMFDVTVLDSQMTKRGTQYHIVRHNTLTGEMEACVVSFAGGSDDSSWASCNLVYEDK
jgi:hypothetical protein